MSIQDSPSSLIIDPIGFVRARNQVKFDAPHQPDRSSSASSILEIFPNKGFREGLQDLAGFDYVWLIWWFHRNSNWRPMVLPPRGPRKRRGVFATRSPHRPNPIGITAVRLLSVDGLNLSIGAHDLVDGTPILDIKPYLSSADAFPEASCGWLSEIEAELSKPAQFTVSFSLTAASQLKWLESNRVNFIERAIQLLQRDPSPHRTRRITKPRDGVFRMSCGAWRIYFTVNALQVEITKVSTGYPKKLLLNEGYNEVPDRDEQLAFDQIWPDES